MHSVTNPADGSVYQYDLRPSTADFVSKIWRSRTLGGGVFTSVASGHLELVFSRVQGKQHVFLRGPETRPTQADCPPDGEWLGITLAYGALLPKLVPGSGLVNREIELPDAVSGFWLDGAVWEYPEFKNADAFIDRLARAGLVHCDALIRDALMRDTEGMNSPTRALQRRFQAVTGLSQTALRQIDRARTAALLLREGTPIADVAFELGYYDQAHLTNLVRRLIGYTPSRLQAQADSPPLSII